MLKIDELNVIPKSSETATRENFKQRSIPYEKYFGEMNIGREEKKERIDFSKDMEDKMLFLFSLFAVMKEYERIDNIYLTESLQKAYIDVASKYVEVDDYLERYIKQFASQTIDDTIANLENTYFLSEDRAKYVAENEANTSLNYKDFNQAVKSGKTKKTWHTMEDEKVRLTHSEVDGKTIAIVEPFVVGESLMMFPKDNSFGASAREIVNCRCWLTYS